MNVRSTAGSRRPGEDALTLPAAWRARRHPRRGDSSIAAVGEPSRGRPLSPEDRAEIERVLRDPGSDPELADRGLAHLHGSPNPPGAAVVASVRVHRSVGGVAWGNTEGWVIDHGLPFAACAYAEFGSAAVDGIPGNGPARVVAASRHGAHTRAWWRDEYASRRLRTRLAAADDEVHAEAVERLAGCRRDPAQRAVVSYLVPDRRDWVDECCAAPPDDPLRWMPLLALSSADQLAALGDRVPPRWWDFPTGVVATMVDGLGAAMAPLLTDALDQDLSVPETRTMLGALALLPSDEAFQALVDRLGRKYVQPALLGAMKRFPIRAMRLLAPATRGSSRAAELARELLAGHLLAAPARTAAALPDLPPGVRAVIDSLGAANTRVPDAPADALPPVLLTPPWSRRLTPPEPTVVAGLTPPARQAVTWADGERERWAGAEPATYGYQRREIAIKAIEEYRAGTRTDRDPALFLWGPEESLRPLVGTWRPGRLAGAATWMPAVVARFELDALPLALYAARTNPSGAAAVLLPFLDAEAALLAAGWLARPASVRATAVGWFGRHGTDAVPYLVPAALGEPGQRREDAEGALRHLASEHGADAVVTAARVSGDEAARAIERFLAIDPTELLPDRMPAIGRWAESALLPQVRLRDRTRALPREATAHLLTMLALSKPGAMYPGIGPVREACDPASLAEFSWVLFRGWQAAGAPARDGWALTQLGWLGDDETVRRLAPVIRAWPGEGGHAKAVKGLDVLGEIGTDVALMHLDGIARKVRFPALKARARARIDEVAARLGLTPERLADRLVPDFGLDPDGTLLLDYGPRRFVAGFDEQLRPYVTDEHGRRRKTLPRPGAKDDPERAEAEYRRFTGLRKDVRTVAGDQVRRLESAMVTRRRWTLAEFRDLFVAHPLTWHITRRLVWVASDGDRATAFRIAEDRTLAGITDGALDLPESAVVHIAHPVDLGRDLAAWSELFADYEILQPFPQLGRTVHTLTEDERPSGRLERFEGRTMPIRGVLRLIRRGWERGEPQDRGVTRWISREMGAGRHLVIGLDPGIVAGAGIDDPEQKVLHVRLAGRPDDPRPDRDGPAFDALDPAIISETLANLTEAFVETAPPTV
ncbi:DUF4132 domain-containing protein [Actinoallomurus sp. CA-142502]|uniref:DUF4132 domain-containing protein n=1 Tax=Actinoallomurus sp. CA-142502 TaxID=3239885 RepID=UPI003D8B27D3